MATTYTTKEGDTVSYVAWKFYGSTANKTTEAILLANPFVTKHPARLPAGLILTMPTVDAPAKTTGIKLWE